MDWSPSKLNIVSLERHWTRTQVIDFKKKFTKHVSDQGDLSRIHKEFTQLIKKTNTPIKITKYLSRHFRGEMWMTN